MRFHLSTIIRMRDPSKIWHALEASLRDVTIESARTGRQIILRGLGPSSVSMNHDDFTTLTIEEQQGAALIEADVFFDGSYLGDFTGQERAVSSKLNHMFSEIQEQFDLEEMRTFRVPVMAEAQVSRDEPGTRAEAGRETTAPVSTGTFSSAAKRVKREDHDSAFNDHGGPSTRRFMDISHAGSRQFGYLAASVSALVLILAGIEGVEGNFHREKAGQSAANLPLAMKQEDSKSSSSERAAPAPIPPQSRDYSADTKTLLRSWESAMRTRDAAAQSSFYSDPVDFYQNQASLSRTFVQQEKQAAIEDRKGLWTVKLEGIVIEPESENEVRVRLVKHFIEQAAPSHVSEWFVQTQLFLKRVDGDWKITSERDFTESASPPAPALTASNARSAN